MVRLQKWGQTQNDWRNWTLLCAFCQESKPKYFINLGFRFEFK